MLIGIDGNEANITHRVGVGQYAFNLLWQLYRLKTHRYLIYLKNPPLLDLPPASPHWQYRNFGPGKLWTKIALPFHLYFDRTPLDLFYSPSHYSPHFSPYPTIPTIHDLGYLQSLDEFNKKDIHQLVHWTKHSIDHAHHLIAVSQFTKNEIIKTYHLSSSKISVVPNGAGDPPSKINPHLIKKFNITTPYFLYLGTLKPNKNIPFLIKSFSQFLQSSKAPKLQSSKALKLVIAGKKGWHFDEIFQTVRQLQLESKIIFTDYIDEATKWSLLSQAKALIIPSTYEGFGIPAIEAMKVNTPVIASSIPAFTEVVGSAGLFINPTNQSELASSMNQILRPSIRQKLIRLGQIQAKQYTWENSAKQLLSAFSLV